jgi:hypothetical protein
MESAILLQSPEKMVLGLYEALLECWNRRDARGMADLFAIEGNLIGRRASSPSCARSVLSRPRWSSCAPSPAW